MNPEVTAPGRFVVKVSWDPPQPGHRGPPVDVDLQALAFLNNGLVLDAVYWNKPRSKDGTITHTSGDEGGHGSSADAVTSEELVVNLSLLSPAVASIVFTVSSFNASQPLDQAPELCITLEHQSTGDAAAAASSGYHKTTFPTWPGAIVGVGGVLQRMGKAAFQVDERAAPMPGVNFVECVDALRAHAGLPPPPPGAPPFSIPLTLSKGQQAEVFAAPDVSKAMHTSTSGDTTAPRVVVAGCGWDVSGSKDDAADVDLSAVLLDASQNIVHRVYWGQLDACNGAVKHSGDNASGEDSDGRVGGDDETVTLDLGRLPKTISDVCFIVNNYDEGSLDAIKNVHFRLFAPRTLVTDERELVTVSHVGAGRDHNGFALALLHRDAYNGWRVTALNDAVDGPSLLSPVVSERVVGVVREALEGTPAPLNMREAMAAPAPGQRPGPQAGRQQPPQQHAHQHFAEVRKPGNAATSSSTAVPNNAQQHSAPWLPAAFLFIVLAIIWKLFA